METVGDKLRNPWVRLIGLIILVGLVGWLVYEVRDVLIPFALAVIVAYILDPLVDALERRKVPRPLAIVILTLCVIIAIGGVALFVVLDVQASLSKGPAPAEEAPEGEPGAGQDESAPPPEESVPPALDEPPPEPSDVSPDEGGSNGQEQEAPGAEESGATAREWVDQQLEVLIDNLPEKYRPIARDVAVKLYQVLRTRYNEVLSSVAGAASKAGKTAWGIVSWIIQFAVFVVVTLYMLNDIDRLRASAVAHLPLRYKDGVLRVAGKINSDLRSFFRGQLMVALILALIYFVGLLIAGIPYPLPVALIGGLGNFIPYLGTLLGISFGLVASLAVYGIDLHLVYVLIVFAVGQLLEGNLITPKIVGKSVGLNPVTVIFSIMIFGKLLGIFGVLFAVPLASSVRVLLGELLPKMDLQDHRAEQGEEPPEGRPPGEEEPGQEEEPTDV